MSSKNNNEFSCNECTKTFTKKNNLKDHIFAKHFNEKKYVCSVCKKSFSYKQSLNRHMDAHKVDVYVYSCSECNYSSELKCMLTRHIKSVHMNKNGRVSCMFCKHNFSQKSLISHYMLCHKTEIIAEHLKFDSLDAFYAWKYKIEEQDISRFVKARVTYIHVSGSQHLFFKCNRDGIYKPKGNNKRKLKTLGTNKIGLHCPARMDVQVEGNDISVRYIKTHIGHELEPKRLFLAKNDKEYLAEQLIIHKTNYDDILNVAKTSNPSSRFHHLTRKDLDSIKTSFKKTAMKSNTFNMSENSDKLNNPMEINNVFDEDLVAFYDVQNDDESIFFFNENVEAQTDKQDLINVNNTLQVMDQMDIKTSSTNKIDPIYDLRAEPQIIESNEQIPILKFNQEMLDTNQVINYQHELTNIENGKLCIMERMKEIVNHIVCNDEINIVYQGLVNITNSLDERRNAIDEAVLNGDLDHIMTFD